MERYRLFGVRLDSEHRFRVPLTPGSGDAQLTLEYAAAPLPEPRGQDVLYRSPLRGPDGESVAVLHAVREGELFRFPPDGRFLLCGDRIISPRPGPGRYGLLEIRFLGALMAYWLERRGVLALHASAVEADGRAVAFVAAHGGGKTSLAATFAAAGHRLLTDDLLALDRGPTGTLARSGYSALRMDPTQLARFGLDRSSLRRVDRRVEKWFVPAGRLGDDSFQVSDLPLAAIFLLRRAAGRRTAEVAPAKASEAVIEIISRSFSPYVLEAVGLQPARFARLAAVVDELPVWWLACPPGLERLATARGAVLEVLARGQPGGHASRE